jgi:hypothetical protein
MKRIRWMILAGAALALAIAVVLAPGVFAQGPGGGYGPGGGMGPGGYHLGYGRGMGGPQQSLVAVAAQQLGMTQADLVTELQSGKTIAQVAEGKQVALDTIVDAFVAPRQVWMADAVAQGRMTQAQADAMLAAMRTNVTARLSQPWSPQGNGPGAGFVDQDGDGVCDYAGSGGMGGGRMGAGPMR